MTLISDASSLNADEFLNRFNTLQKLTRPNARFQHIKSDLPHYGSDNLFYVVLTHKQLSREQKFAFITILLNTYNYKNFGERKLFEGQVADELFNDIELLKSVYYKLLEDKHFHLSEEQEKKIWSVIFNLKLQDNSMAPEYKIHEDQKISSQNIPIEESKESDVYSYLNKMLPDVNQSTERQKRFLNYCVDVGIQNGEHNLLIFYFCPEY